MYRVSIGLSRVKGISIGLSRVSGPYPQHGESDGQ